MAAAYDEIKIEKDLALQQWAHVILPCPLWKSSQNAWSDYFNIKVHRVPYLIV